VEKQGRYPTKAEKKESMNRRVLDGVPVGILAYHGEEPVAWCSIAPRETYRALGGDETKPDVWSLLCFFVRRSHRGRNLSARLIGEAVGYAGRNGARYVEAYPVDPESPSYRFMGFTGMFEKAGFREVKRAGKRRRVMILAL
jgi:GNAT superfamily N-acetyltransferase